MAEPLLRLEKLAKDFGSVTAVKPTTIDIDKGEFFALLGPSGCGKTTLLKMIGGFTQPQARRIIGLAPLNWSEMSLYFGLHLR